MVSAVRYPKVKTPCRVLDMNSATLYSAKAEQQQQSSTTQNQEPNPVKPNWGFYNIITIMSWCQHTSTLGTTHINKLFSCSPTTGPGGVRAAFLQSL